MEKEIKLYAIAGLALVIGLMLVKKNISEIVQDVAAGAVDAVGSVGSGAVLGVGDVLGIPRTSETECDKAMREGRSWDASFACPAGTFLKYMTGMGA